MIFLTIFVLILFAFSLVFTILDIYADRTECLGFDFMGLFFNMVTIAMLLAV